MSNISIRNSEIIRDKFITGNEKNTKNTNNNKPKNINITDITKCKYSYLDNGELASDFSIIDNRYESSILSSIFLSLNKSNKKIPIIANIVIFTVNTQDCITPFLQYLLFCDTKNKFANLLYKKIYIQSTSNLSNENKISKYIKTQIMNECIDNILELFQIYDIFNETLLEEIFKGFIWNDKTNNIHLFFNMTKYIHLFTGKNMDFDILNIDKSPYSYSTMKWGILDNIYKGHIDGLNISKNIVDLFKENIPINELYIDNNNDNDNKILAEYPLSLYLCYKSNNKWQNIEFNEKVTFLIEKTTPTILGDYYYFSSVPLYPLDKKDFIPERYAVFLNLTNENCSKEQEIYIVKDISEISNEQLDIVNMNKKNITTIWFKDNGIQLWCIKYPKQFHRMSRLILNDNS